MKYPEIGLFGIKLLKDCSFSMLSFKGSSEQQGPESMLDRRYFQQVKFGVESGQL